MTSDLNPLREFDLSPLRSSLAGWSGWESKLADAAGLGKLAWKLGFGNFEEESIQALWRIGLLRADLVTGEMHIEASGFEPVPSPHGCRFIDVRLPKHRPEGSSSFVPKGPCPEDHLTTYFHPYRVFLLHHVVRTLRVVTSNTQFLTYSPGVLRVVDWQLCNLRRWTESEEFIERFDHWNRVTELAIACEPVRWVQPEPEYTFSSDLSWLQAYCERIEVVLQSLPLYVIHNIRQAFAMSADELDSNSGLHTLLRLMKPFERDRICGRIGAAMKFLDMAESIRRAAERILQIHLPEEDEIGPDTWMDGARSNLYGTERVFDASPGTLRDYLGTFGLDAGVKARCYVEGETELGALRHALGSSNQCTFINLRGTVVEKRGRGLAFADSLAADKACGMFSFVMLDADRDDFVRVLRKAAAEEIFHGAFQVSAPDVELANFTVAELLEIALAISATMHDDSLSHKYASSDLLPELKGATSGDDFFSRLHKGGRLTEVSKGEDWGAALMGYAIENRAFPSEHMLSGQERPLIEFVRRLIRAQKAGFRFSLQYEKVNAATGGMQPRQ